MKKIFLSLVILFTGSSLFSQNTGFPQITPLTGNEKIQTFSEFTGNGFVTTADIAALAGGGGSVTVTDGNSIDFTLTGSDITGEVILEDQVNGLDIITTATGVRVDYDFTELSLISGVDNTNDRILIYDNSAGSYGYINPSTFIDVSQGFTVISEVEQITNAIVDNIVAGINGLTFVSGTKKSLLVLQDNGDDANTVEAAILALAPTGNVFIEALDGTSISGTDVLPSGYYSIQNPVGTSYSIRQVSQVTGASENIANANLTFDADYTTNLANQIFKLEDTGGALEFVADGTNASGDLYFRNGNGSNNFIVRTNDFAEIGNRFDAGGDINSTTYRSLIANNDDVRIENALGGAVSEQIIVDAANSEISFFVFEGANLHTMQMTERKFRTDGNFQTSGVITAAITNPENDFNPSQLSTSSIIRLTLVADTDLTGINAVQFGNGSRLTLCNVSTFNLSLIDESASSASFNRFQLNSDITVIPEQCITIFYDQTSNAWRSITP